MTDHPITPPPELVMRWATSSPVQHSDESWAYELFIAHQAARWGADQEMDACLEWFSKFYHLETWRKKDLERFRAARRPKPPSLKEQALETLRSMQIEPCWINGINTNAELMSKYDIIRRALEAL